MRQTCGAPHQSRVINIVNARVDPPRDNIAGPWKGPLRTLQRPAKKGKLGMLAGLAFQVYGWTVHGNIPGSIGRVNAVCVWIVCGWKVHLATVVEHRKI